MSDFILKFWPKNEIKTVKTKEIEEGLKDSKIIGESTEFWGKAAFKPGDLIQDFLNPKLERSDLYFDTIALTIEDKNYGVIEGAEDFEYIDRLNVLSIKGGEGAFNEWEEMCDRLKEITGDDYQGGWELL